MSTIALQNSLLLSDTISNGKPCLQNYLQSKAEPTVHGFLSEITTRSSYFEKAAVMHKIKLFLTEGIVFRRLNIYMCTLWLGFEH